MLTLANGTYYIEKAFQLSEQYGTASHSVTRAYQWFELALWATKKVEQKGTGTGRKGVKAAC